MRRYPPSTVNDDEQQRRIVSAFASYIGVTIEWDLTLLASGVVYENRVLAAKAELCPVHAIHDLAHYILAPASRRAKANYGLGPAPHVKESRDAICLVSQNEADTEECLASDLNIVLTGSLLGHEHACESANYVCVDYTNDGWGYRNDLGTLRKGRMVKREFYSPHVAAFLKTHPDVLL